MDLERQLRADVDVRIKVAFGREYADRFPQSFIDAVVSDVRETSAFEEGYYNSTDIQWALARTVLALSSPNEI